MKGYLNKFLIILLSLVLLVPAFVFAEEEAKEEESDVEVEETVKTPVKVYEFYGSTCGHCAALNEWFDSIDDEYGQYFDLIKYEVWESQENAELMNTVAAKLNTEVTGVPFLVVGGKYLSGFDASTDADVVLGYIMEEYEKAEADRIDIVGGKYEEPDAKTRDLIVGIVFAVLGVGLVAVCINARKED